MARSNQRRVASRAAGRPAQLHVSPVVGLGGSATALTLTGITPADHLVSVLDFEPPTATDSAEFGSRNHAGYTSLGYDTVTIGGTIDTTGKMFLVIWYDTTPPYGLQSYGPY